MPWYVAPKVEVQTPPKRLVALKDAKSDVGSYALDTERKKLRTAGAAPVVKLPTAIDAMSVDRLFIPEPTETNFVNDTAYVLAVSLTVRPSRR